MAREYQGGGVWSNVISPDDERRSPIDPNSSSSNSSTSGESKSGDASKEFREIEKLTLVGDCEVYPDIKLKAKSTVLLNGLGKNLSGLYFVDQVKRVWGKNGFSQTMQVSRNALGDSIKKGSVVQTVPTPAPVVSVREEPKPQVVPAVEKRTHILAKGETLWGLAEYYYKDGTKWTRIADENGIPLTDYAVKHLSIGTKLTIP